MDSAVLAARLVLAAIFAVAAVGKFIDLRGSRASLVGFGVPEQAASVLGTLLPFAELAVAIALIPRPSAQWGAIGAVVLLAAFIAGIANAMRQGEAPPCNCFGAIHSAPAGKTTLARNVGLGAIAILAAGWGPGPALDHWVSARTAAELVAVALGIAAVVLAAFALPVWLENRRLRRDLDIAEGYVKQIPLGLRVGTLAPEFSIPDGFGGELTLSGLLARGRPVILVFTVAGCGPCDTVIPTLERLQEIATDRLTVAAVGMNTILRYREWGERVPEIRLLDATDRDPELAAAMDHLHEVMNRYQAYDSPAAVLVTPAGTIGSAVADGRPAIEALIRLTLAGAMIPARPPRVPAAA
jgi:peroxiredoxin